MIVSGSLNIGHNQDRHLYVAVKFCFKMTISLLEEKVSHLQMFSANSANIATTANANELLYANEVMLP